MRRLVRLDRRHAERVRLFLAYCDRESSAILEAIDPGRAYPSRLEDDTCVLAKLGGIGRSARDGLYLPALREAPLPNADDE